MKKWLPFLLLPSLLMAGGDLQSKIRQARQKVFPALVHIQPIKEFVDSGEPQKV